MQISWVVRYAYIRYAYVRYAYVRYAYIIKYELKKKMAWRENVSL